MVRGMGLSPSSVGRIWHAFGFRPHRQETFELSFHPAFFVKPRAIVGSYLNPLMKALVLCADEMSQIRTRDRTEPSSPLAPGMSDRPSPGLRMARRRDVVRSARCRNKDGPSVACIHADAAQHS